MRWRFDHSFDVVIEASCPLGGFLDRAGEAELAKQLLKPGGLFVKNFASMARLLGLPPQKRRDCRLNRHTCNVSAEIKNAACNLIPQAEQKDKAPFDAAFAPSVEKAGSRALFWHRPGERRAALRRATVAY